MSVSGNDFRLALQQEIRTQSTEAFNRFFNHLDRLSAYPFLVWHLCLVIRGLCLAPSDNATWTIHGLTAMFFHKLVWDWWILPVILYTVRWVFRYDENWYYPHGWIWYLYDLEGPWKGVWVQIHLMHQDMNVGNHRLQGDPKQDGIAGWMRRNL